MGTLQDFAVFFFLTRAAILGRSQCARTTGPRPGMPAMDLNMYETKTNWSWRFVLHFCIGTTAKVDTFAKPGPFTGHTRTRTLQPNHPPRLAGKRAWAQGYSSNLWIQPVSYRNNLRPRTSRDRLRHLAPRALPGQIGKRNRRKYVPLFKHTLPVWVYTIAVHTCKHIVVICAFTKIYRVKVYTITRSSNKHAKKHTNYII